MKFPSKGIFYIFLVGLTQKAVTLECQSPQYVIIGEEGILECSFPSQFQAIVWYDCLNTTEALVTKIEKQDTGNLKVSGNGYEDGIYNIFLNGSLIIPHVTIYHERTFKVTLIDENLGINDTEIVVITTEAKDDSKEYDHPFPTAALVIIILLVVAAFGILLGVIYYVRKHKSGNIGRGKDDNEAAEEENEKREGEENDDDREAEEEKMNPATLGAAESGVKFDHDDKLVNSIDDIEYGDHIVFSSWLLHPRCHGIVVDKNEEGNELLVIRFTYQNGVMEEWLPLKSPTYRITRYYIGDKKLKSDCCSIDVVISRARSLKGSNKLTYNLTKNTCKTFARWCKTGIVPFGVRGYDYE